MKKGILVVLIILSLLIITGCSSNDVAKPTATNTPVVTEEAAVETATPSPTPKTIEEELTIGDIVLFGSYEQDGNEENGAEPLEWIVIKQEKNRVLMLTKYAFEVMDFAPQGSDGRWVISSIREWLNSTFYEQSFSEPEKQRTIITPLQNYYREDVWYARNAQGADFYHPGKELIEDEETDDYIFLLTAEEADQLDISIRICKPTTYALDNGAKIFRSGDCSWWLRSVGISQSTVGFVMQNREVGSYYTVAEGRCVRAAVWVETGE